MAVNYRTRERIWRRQGEKCNICGKNLHQQDATLDHIKQRALGGSNEDGNLQVLCLWCHRTKDDPFGREYSAPRRRKHDYYSLRPWIARPSQSGAS